jgi:hypothetical protein
MIDNTNRKTGSLVQGTNGRSETKKFIPKKLATNEIGMNKVVMIVSVFMISFMRLLTTDRMVSLSR